LTAAGTHELLDSIEGVLWRFLDPPQPPQTRCPQQADIRQAAFWLVQAELLQLPDFGIRMLARDLERLTAMQAAPTSAPDSVSLALDAARMPGHVALALAVRLAAETMRSQGAAILGVRNVGALGVLGCAARSLAADGAVAMVSANSAAFVAPWGGTAASIGTNPLAVAAPRLDATPLVIDYSTSPITLAALRRAQANGSALPPPGALDRSGRHTDAAQQAVALVPQGRISSLTGLAMELITGVGIGGRRPAGTPAQERTAVVIAYDPLAMGNHAVGELCAQLVRDWQGAGGHVPRRFDALPLQREQLPASLTIDGEALARLQALRPSRYVP